LEGKANEQKNCIKTSDYLRYSLAGFANYNYSEMPKSKSKNDRANFSLFNSITAVRQEQVFFSLTNPVTIY